MSDKEHPAQEEKEESILRRMLNTSPQPRKATPKFDAEGDQAPRRKKGLDA